MNIHCIDDVIEGWENPPQSDDETEQLKLILGDLSSGVLSYEGTKYTQLLSIIEIFEPDEIKCGYEDLRSFYQMAQDYCLGQIASTQGEERMKNVRRSMLIDRRLNEIPDPIDNDPILVTAARLLRSGQDKLSISN